VTAWSLACPDWIARIQTGRTLVPDLPLLRGEAERAVTIFNRLRQCSPLSVQRRHRMNSHAKRTGPAAGAAGPAAMAAV